jgi:hypothetical protein
VDHRLTTAANVHPAILDAAGLPWKGSRAMDAQRIAAIYCVTACQSGYLWTRSYLFTSGMTGSRSGCRRRSCTAGGGGERGQADVNRALARLTPTSLGGNISA